MKIHAYILCYNEQDIITHTLNYYSTFCSRIFLLDNYSTDNSIKIAKQFKKVSILQWWSGNKLNDYKNIEIKQNYYKVYSRQEGSMCVESADWVITCDMDELIYHPRLIKILESYKRQRATVANIIGFNMVSEKGLDEMDSLIGSVRTGVQSRVFSKPILFSADFDMIFSPGCHPYGAGYDQMQQQPLYKKGRERIALLHYKYIGNRSINNARRSVSRLSQTNISNNLGKHYQKTCQELQEKARLMRTRAREVLDETGNIIFEAGF